MSITTLQRRQAIHQLGTRADKRQFVPFSRNTNSDQGRRVFIDVALAPMFAHLLNPSSAKGIQTIAKIEQLRAVAGSVKSSTNVQAPVEHMDTFGDLAVYYQICSPPAKEQTGSKAGKTELKPGVYITDVTYSGKEARAPRGLYVSKDEGGRNRFRLVENDIAETDIGIIRSAPTLRDAEAVSKKIAGPNGWGGHKEFNLFYIPEMVQNEMGLWMTPNLRAYRPKEAARHLAKVLMETQRNRKNIGPINWTLEGDGVKLLQMALEDVTGILDNHHFKMIDAVADIVKIVNTLERKGARLDNESVEYSRKNKRALAAAAVSAQRGQLSQDQQKAELKLKDAARRSSGALAGYDSNYRKVESDFLSHVKSLRGALAW